MKIGIIIAMEKEFVQLQTLLDNPTKEEHAGKQFVCGRMGDKDIVMLQSGIGKVNAAIGAVEIINHYQPDVVVSTGVAGGADVNLEVMDVVASTDCTYHDVYCGSEVARGQFVGLPPTFPTPSTLVEKALALNNPKGNNRVVAGEIVTGDWFVDSREKMRSILDNFPKAVAVDMESCAIAQTCHLFNVPFISFRIISDIPLKDNKASQYYDFWARMAEGSFSVTRRFLEQL
ncbi:MAG: 5'-methylthioadenosine/adenosylhomocysteine nucleosidase [Prevotella sp.]|nr:5'-methylthioadenosine/adenosylhomocysteine nucleosidase [Prevotella sp.]